MESEPTRPSSSSPESEARLALACLIHPWSLLALAVLALNDHWWKGIGPGWLTGKLSDFAGLFYFPFLVISLVGLLSRRQANGDLAIGRLVFWAVGIWFAAAKSIPFVHATTVRVVESLIGSVEVVRDPSDAIAVVALLPAWLLYRYLACQPRRSLGRALRPAALGVAVLLTAATSKPRPPSVKRLIVHDGRLFALVNNERDYDGQRGRAFSTVDGATWAAAELPAAVLRAHKPRRVLTTRDGAFRLDDHAVLRVRDGQTVTAWSISEDRRQFMKVAGGDWWRAVDIAAVPQSPDTLVVALGSEGIVVRNGDGTWTRRAVGPARPTPQRASIDRAISLVVEVQGVFGVATALIAWGLMSFLTWSLGTGSPVPTATSREAASLGHRFRSIATVPMRLLRRLRFDVGYIAAAVFGIALPGFTLVMFRSPPPVLDLLAVPLLAPSLVFIEVGWIRFFKANPDASSHAEFRTALATGFLALTMLILWDLGWIESRAVAIVAAGIVALGAVWLWAARVGRHL